MAFFTFLAVSSIVTLQFLAAPLGLPRPSWKRNPGCDNDHKQEIGKQAPEAFVHKVPLRRMGQEAMERKPGHKGIEETHRKVQSVRQFFRSESKKTDGGSGQDHKRMRRKHENSGDGRSFEHPVGHFEAGDEMIRARIGEITFS